MRFAIAIITLSCFTRFALGGSTTPLELKKASDDNLRFILSETGREFAVTMPDEWQGNINIISPNGKHCGVMWPHFLMMSAGQWLTDKVESEGQKLQSFRILSSSGAVVGYHGEWKFRDFFISSETHFVWYEPANTTQIHLVITEVEILKDVRDITTTWIEFMTPENSYTTVAAKKKRRQYHHFGC